MKAVIMFQKGELPQYVENFQEPVTQKEDEVIISMRSAAIKHLDRSVASGKHYSAQNDLSKAKVIGGDGVGVLWDGTRVFAFGGSGMLAEKAVVNKNTLIKLPDGIDDITAAALPNAVAGSAMALRFRAGIKGGETVLINGATGFTGRMALQVAKHYGAKKIIVTGRNESSLNSLRDLGATEIISLQQNEEQFIMQLKETHKEKPVDIIVDYLWGHPAEMILQALKGSGNFTPKTRFVSVGSMAGDKIQLSAEILRSVDLQLSGSGLGSWTQEEIKIMLSEIIPEFLQLAIDKKLIVDTETIQLADIQKLWEMEIPGGKRLVAII